MNEILAANTGRSLEEIERDTERDNYMSAAEPRSTVSSTRFCPITRVTGKVR